MYESYSDDTKREVEATHLSEKHDSITSCVVTCPATSSYLDANNCWFQNMKMPLEMTRHNWELIRILPTYVWLKMLNCCHRYDSQMLFQFIYDKPGHHMRIIAMTQIGNLE